MDSTTETITFEQLFDVVDLQRMQDEFAEALGVASVITRPDGSPITPASHFCRLCADIIRGTPEGCRNCFRSDAAIGAPRTDGPTVQQCLSGGLWDAGAAITVNGTHVASWLIGQVRDESIDEGRIRAYAKTIGADAEDAVRAFREVPAMSRERFAKIARMLFSIANKLSSIAYQNLQLRNSIAERSRADEQRRLAASVFATAGEGIAIVSADATILDANAAFTDITGISREEALGGTAQILTAATHDGVPLSELWPAIKGQKRWSGEVWDRHRQGERFAAALRVNAVADGHGAISHYIAAFSDITALKDQQEQLDNLVHFDALTSLPNRSLLEDRLNQAMQHAVRQRKRLAVAYLDLDGFKNVNDVFGHTTGDRLLTEIAARMTECLREGDTLARLGGDEFVAVLQDLDSAKSHLPLLQRLLGAITRPIDIGGETLQVSASIGVTFFPQDEEIDAEQLLRQADQAMYQAKLAGKNRHHVFDPQADRTARGLHQNLDNIRGALENRQLVLYYQPKVNMRSGEVVGAEALIRWQHPVMGLLSPAAFLPPIESSELGVAVGEWVIHQALDQIQSWRRGGLTLPVSINISAFQLQQPDFIDRLATILAEHPGVDRNHLMIEVLETSALEDLAGACKVIERCREMGVSIALDDFGTGYSSLTYLKRLPVQEIKIDQSFVRDMLDDPDDLTILKGIIGLATSFRRKVIAEGVETIEHGELLLQLGCELAQGYVIARPMPAAQLTDWIAVWQPDSSWRDQHRVRREDFALLLGAVEHRAWVSAVEAFCEGKRDRLPSLNADDCSLAQWLAENRYIRVNDNPAIRHLESHHQRLHDAVSEIESCRRQQQMLTPPQRALPRQILDALLGEIRFFLKSPY